MKNLIVVGAVLVVVFVVIGLVYGWIQYRQSADKATIDIHTHEIKEEVEEAADKAVGTGKRLIEETGRVIESTGEELQDAENGEREEDSDAEAPLESTPRQP